MFPAFGCLVLLRRVPVYRAGVPHPGLRKKQSFSATFIHPGQGRFLQLGDPRFRVAQWVLVNRAACSETAIADSGRSRRFPMLSTDIAPVYYRSSRGSLPATSTTDIPGREWSQGTKTQPCPMRQRQAAEVGSAESRSRVAEATSRFSTEYYSGACFSLVSTRSWISEPMRRLAAGKSYSRAFGFRLRRIGTIA